MSKGMRNTHRIWLSKRAEEVEETPEAPNYAIYFMIAAVIIALFAIFLVIATSAYQVETTSILGDLESAVMEFRLLNSPECFAYQDDVTKRVFPHIMDLDKFTEERAAKCISPSSTVCFKSDLWVGGKMIGSVKSRNYLAPREIKVSLWPVIAKGKDEEKEGIMSLSTSKVCI